MADRADRCARQALLRGDEMLGTAFPANRILLIEQPTGWGLAGLAGSSIDPSVAAAVLERFSASGVRVLMIRRPGRQPEPARRSWGFADCRPGQQAMVWGSFGPDSDLLDLDPQGLAERARQQPDLRPVYAVCAHGKHDMCCAIEGRPIAAALQEHCPGRVWECSHVGGDRFAANVLVLPSGLQYGRVTDAAALARATESGRVLPEQLRGLIGLPAATQAAIVHAQRVLGLTEVAAVRPLPADADSAAPTTEPLPEGAVVIRLVAGGTPVSVGVQRVAGEAARLTCRAGSDRRPISYRPLWLRQEG